MNGTQNVNLDTKTLDQCLKEINYFGKTVYQNICTGQVNTVPWGGVDWLLTIILAGIGIAFVLLLLKILYDDYKIQIEAMKLYKDIMQPQKAVDLLKKKEK